MRFTRQMKLEALDLRFRLNTAWKVEGGDYFTTVSPRLDLWHVIGVAGGKVFYAPASVRESKHCHSADLNTFACPNDPQGSLRVLVPEAVLDTPDLEALLVEQLKSAERTLDRTLRLLESFAPSGGRPTLIAPERLGVLSEAIRLIEAHRGRYRHSELATAGSGLAEERMTG